MPAAVLLAAMLGLVVWNIRNGRGFSAKLADLIGRTSRKRAVFGWAAGTAIYFGWTSAMALVLLNRVDAIVTIPVELQAAAWRLGLPGEAAPGDVTWLLLYLCGGLLLGLSALLILRRMGRAPAGIRYRSPAAVRQAGEWPGAVALSLAAGIGEELFFRLTLPLLVAIVTGSGLAGCAVGLVAFGASHRHQGWAGVLATGIVGVFLAGLYLLTGQLWLAMLVHVVIDLNALVLRPMLFPARK
jgi:membrane protease YdiL (CAAX protease family)